MNRICFITRNYKDTNSAGNKAKTDMENILISLGATNLGLQRTFYKSHIIAFFLNLCGIIKASLLLSPNDRLVLQYPLKKILYMDMSHSSFAKCQGHNASS